MSKASRRPSSPSLLAATVLTLAAGCSQMPTVGPSSADIRNSAAAGSTAATAIQIVDVDDRVARQLASQRRLLLFSESLGRQRGSGFFIGSGDTIEVNIWEAPPATLFGAGVIDVRSPALARATSLPEQMVDSDGFIMVPFAGRIRVGGQSVHAVEAEIAAKLKGKANQPEVLVRVLRGTSSSVTVVGEVTNSMRMPLTAGGERLLDALAAAGGVRQSVSKMTVQVTRGSQYQALPLDVVIRDPQQNIPLHPGDVVTAIFQPLSFTALGATGKNEEISFETQGISLAQALARAGGLLDSRSNPQGVFIFRFEPEQALSWPRTPVVTTPDGLVPVVYRFDLLDPSSFFVMQGFQIRSKDILYVANSPAAELQKFLNLVFSVAYPVLNAVQATK